MRQASWLAFGPVAQRNHIGAQNWLGRGPAARQDFGELSRVASRRRSGTTAGLAPIQEKRQAPSEMLRDDMRQERHNNEKDADQGRRHAEPGCSHL